MAGTYEEIQAFRFGRDLVLPRPDKEVQPTASGDWPTQEGRTNLLDAHVRRAIAAPGEMVHRPLYGGGLPLAVEAPADFATLARVSVAVRQNALRDERLQEATATVTTLDARGGAVKVELEIRPRGEDTGEAVTVVQE